MLAIFVSMLILGLVTSIHCISMCGPMVVTYAVKGEEDGPWYRKLVPNLAYQVAKIMSYVIVGLALGAIGSAFNLDGVRPYIMLVAGVFMIIMGLGMTGKVPWAAKLTPRPPNSLLQAQAMCSETDITSVMFDSSQTSRDSIIEAVRHAGFGAEFVDAPLRFGG